MRWDLVYEGESLNELSARLGVPACMLMRANRLWSEAWLLPGREILVPDADFCLRDTGMCPRSIFHTPARRTPERKDLKTHEENYPQSNHSRLY